MLWWILACLGFALFGYAYGRAVGYRNGRRNGFHDGRKTGTFWERKHWMESR